MSVLRYLLLFLLPPLWSVAAFAQSGAAITPEQFRDELARRDKLIIQLINRVEALESRLAGRQATTDSAIKPPPSLPPAPPGSGPDQPPEQEFAVDALAAERALERSLVQQGGRLLSPGQVEVTPSLTYSRYDDDFPSLVALGSGSTVGEIEQSLDLLNGNLGIRAGLPMETQIELDLPYRSVHVESARFTGSSSESLFDRTGSGAGDIRLGLAKQLLDQQGGWPNLVGRLVWITGSGTRESGGVAIGGGNEGLAARFSAYWRRDPIVFLLGGGYSHYYNSGLRIGDTFDLSLGTALAVSPETAMTFSLEQSYSEELERDGQSLPGTDSLSSVFNISASTLMGQGVLMRIHAGIGLTADAPDYSLGLSIPIRFSL